MRGLPMIAFVKFLTARRAALSDLLAQKSTVFASENYLPATHELQPAPPKRGRLSTHKPDEERGDEFPGFRQAWVDLNYSGGLAL